MTCRVGGLKIDSGPNRRMSSPAIQQVLVAESTGLHILLKAVHDDLISIFGGGSVHILHLDIGRG